MIRSKLTKPPPPVPPRPSKNVVAEALAKSKKNKELRVAPPLLSENLPVEKITVCEEKQCGRTIVYQSNIVKKKNDSENEGTLEGNCERNKEKENEVLEKSKKVEINEGKSCEVVCSSKKLNPVEFIGRNDCFTTKNIRDNTRVDSINEFNFGLVIEDTHNLDVKNRDVLKETLDIKEHNTKHLDPKENFVAKDILDGAKNDLNAKNINYINDLQLSSTYLISKVPTKYNNDTEGKLNFKVYCDIKDHHDIRDQPSFKDNRFIKNKIDTKDCSNLDDDCSFNDHSEKELNFKNYPYLKVQANLKGHPDHSYLQNNPDVINPYLKSYPSSHNPDPIDHSPSYHCIPKDGLPIHHPEQKDHFPNLHPIPKDRPSKETPIAKTRSNSKEQQTRESEQNKLNTNSKVSIVSIANETDQISQKCIYDRRVVDISKNGIYGRIIQVNFNKKTNEPERKNEELEELELKKEKSKELEEKQEHSKEPEVKKENPKAEKENSKKLEAKKGNPKEPELKKESLELKGSKTNVNCSESFKQKNTDGDFVQRPRLHSFPKKNDDKAWDELLSDRNQVYSLIDEMFASVINHPEPETAKICETINDKLISRVENMNDGAKITIKSCIKSEEREVEQDIQNDEKLKPTILVIENSSNYKDVPKINCLDHTNNVESNSFDPASDYESSAFKINSGMKSLNSVELQYGLKTPSVAESQDVLKTTSNVESQVGLKFSSDCEIHSDLKSRCIFKSNSFKSQNDSHIFDFHKCTYLETLGPYEPRRFTDSAFGDSSGETNSEFSSKSSDSTAERKRNKFNQRRRHHDRTVQTSSLDQERMYLKRQRRPSNSPRIRHSDWTVFDDGEEVRLSSCQITIDEGKSCGGVFKDSGVVLCRSEGEMSNLQGLPPLPKSLSGFSLMETPQTPNRPGSSRTSSVSTGSNGQMIYSPHSKAGINGSADSSLKKMSSLDSKLAILRREMVSIF